LGPIGLSAAVLDVHFQQQTLKEALVFALRVLSAIAREGFLNLEPIGIFINELRNTTIATRI
jgi:hypothetical protein